MAYCLCLIEPEAGSGTGSIGKPIADQQGMQFMVAEMANELEVARLLVYYAHAEPELRFSQESAMAKMYTSEIALRVVHKALQFLGGYGNMTEYPTALHHCRHTPAVSQPREEVIHAMLTV